MYRPTFCVTLQDSVGGDTQVDKVMQYMNGFHSIWLKIELFHTQQKIWDVIMNPDDTCIEAGVLIGFDLEGAL